MKILASKLLYYIGDFISRTSMQYGNGIGYSLYNKIMLLSCDLDKEGKVWKYVKPKRKKKKCQR